MVTMPICVSSDAGCVLCAQADEVELSLVGRGHRHGPESRIISNGYGYFTLIFLAFDLLRRAMAIL
jgi:hypothetical protein